MGNYNLESLVMAAKCQFERLGLDTFDVSHYIEYLKEQAPTKTREMALHLYTDNGSIMLAIFIMSALQDEQFRLKLSYSDKNCTIYYTVCTGRPDTKKDPLYVVDMFEYSNAFIVIDSIVRDPLYGTIPNAGAEVLDELCIKFTDFPILVQVGYLLSGDYNRANDEQDSIVIDKLVKFYSKCKFTDVNEQIGNYTDSVIMLRDNKAKLGIDSNSQNSKATSSITAFN